MVIFALGSLRWRKALAYTQPTSARILSVWFQRFSDCPGAAESMFSNREFESLDCEGPRSLNPLIS
jgi:hypothetical protein